MDKKQLPCRSPKIKPSKADSKYIGVLNDCHMECDTCGFNPNVSKQRLEKGYWKENTTMTVVNIGSDGFWAVHEASGLNQLIFPKGIRASTK